MSEAKSMRTKWLHLRLKPDEHTKLQKEFSKSTCRKMSAYARKKLMDKPVTTYFRNQSMDDLMTEAVKLRNELNNVGNNFNQAVKKLNTLNQIQEFRNWIIAYEIDKKELLNKVEEIKNCIKNIAEKWLQ